ncbi:MAG: aldo/keto reductase [Pirellulales bacterium]|nr:aldo/keto reductase [Pirellulales bacterium]
MEIKSCNIDKSLRDLHTDCLDLVQMHTWSRAWNRDPVPFEILRDCQRQGKVQAIGVSTPEIDQNAVVDLMRGGYRQSYASVLLGTRPVQFGQGFRGFGRVAHFADDLVGGRDCHHLYGPGRNQGRCLG